MWVATSALPRSPGHPFYERLNRILDEAGFDRFVEDRCTALYAASQERPRFLQGVLPDAAGQLLRRHRLAARDLFQRTHRSDGVKDARRY
jgi:hypothetical protein